MVRANRALNTCTVSSIPRFGSHTYLAYISAENQDSRNDEAIRLGVGAESHRVHSKVACGTIPIRVFFSSQSPYSLRSRSVCANRSDSVHSTEILYNLENRISLLPRETFHWLTLGAVKELAKSKRDGICHLTTRDGEIVQ